jgi:MoxR-like ATPase
MTQTTHSTFPLEKFLTTSDQIIVGKRQELQLALCCLLARGHLLIEDLPGMGKTTFVLLLSQLLDLPYKRIQFTNDLLPADILGVQILSEDRKSFHFHKGPLFSELVLADELNRGSPKTQSALLQAMEERSITIDGETLPLPSPFFLIATQNPTEHAGAFPLPESQLDRFMLRIELGYPQQKEEIEILKRGDVRSQIKNLSPLIKRQDLIDFQRQVDQIHASEAILQYIHSLLQKTRVSPQFKMGLSPRSGLLLLQAARSWAFLQERNLVLPEDVKMVAPHVMKHRLPSPQGSSLQTNENIQNLLQQTPVPV